MAVVGIANEININLSAFNSFEKMRSELINRLSLVNEPIGGRRVSIDTGQKTLNIRQVQEIKAILAEKGIRLQDLSFKNSSDIPADDEEEKTSFGQLPAYDNTALICRHIRSGQKFFSEGNVVVLGDVNPGAEVIAGGNIIVMGSLRGMIHAGAFGDEEAVVAAYRLNPTQLRIANHITRPPDGEPIIVQNPEIAKIRAGRVCIEKLKI